MVESHGRDGLAREQFDGVDLRLDGMDWEAGEAVVLFPRGRVLQKDDVGPGGGQAREGPARP